MQLLTQMYASIRYIQTHHNYGSIPSQPDQNPYSRNQPASVPPSAALPPESGANGTNTLAQSPTAETIAPIQQQHTQNSIEDTSGLRPDPPHTFEAALKELAQDLVIKEQQIEYLIEVLPGIGRGEEDQDKKIRELEERLREVEIRRKEAVEVKEKCVERLNGTIGRIRRI